MKQELRGVKILFLLTFCFFLFLIFVSSVCVFVQASDCLLVACFVCSFCVRVCVSFFFLAPCEPAPFCLLLYYKQYHDSRSRAINLSREISLCFHLFLSVTFFPVLHLFGSASRVPFFPSLWPFRFFFCEVYIPFGFALPC